MRKARGLRGFNEVLTLRFFGLFFFMVLTRTSHYAQPANETSIIDLKNGTVYFVLPTAAEKLYALRAATESTQNQRNKEHLLKLISREQMEVDSFSGSLMSAVEQHYTFSDFDFIPDTILKQLVIQRKETSRPIYIVRRATTESGADALVMYDDAMQPLTRPIPYYARLGRFTSFIDAFFGKSDFSWRDLNEVIRKWSDRLEVYYDKKK